MKTLNLFTTVFFALALAGCKQENKIDLSEQLESQATSEATLVTSYADSLRKLPPVPNSSNHGLELFSTRFKSTDQTQNDVYLKEYLMFQAALIDSLNRLLEKNPDYDSIESLIWADESMHSIVGIKFEKELNDFGLELASTEGTIYITRKLLPIRDAFFDHLTPGTQQFFNQFEREANEGTSEDGALTIPETTLAQRIAFWDGFLLKFPNHLFSDYAKSERDYGLYYLLVGMDNTPAFDYDSHKMYEEFKQAIVYLIESYPNLPVAKTLKGYQQLLEKHSYEEHAEVKAFSDQFRPWRDE